MEQVVQTFALLPERNRIIKYLLNDIFNKLHRILLIVLGLEQINNKTIWLICELYIKLHVNMSKSAIIYCKKLNNKIKY